MNAPPQTRLSKYTAGGRLAWSLIFPAGLWGSRNLAVLPSGDVVSGACTAPYCLPAADATPVFGALVRFASSDGHVVWRAPLPAPPGALSSDAAARVASVYGVNSTTDGSGAHVFIVSDSGGVVFDQPTDVRWPHVAIGGTSGDFVVGGVDSTNQLVFERRRPDGSLVFHDVLSAPGGAIDRIDFAPNGSIALGGWTSGPLSFGNVTYAGPYSSGFILVTGGDGTPQWAKFDGGFMASSGYPPMLAFGRDNEVIAFTMTFGKGQANLRDYTRDGVLRWRHDFRGIYGTWINAVAVATSGDVVVGGNGTADAPFQSVGYPRETQFVAVIAH